MADNDHNIADKRKKIIVSASAIVLMLSAVFQMYGVLLLYIIQQQQQIAAAQDMVMLDTMRSIRILKQIKKRIIRRRRRRWINPGRTDRWWQNLWSGKLLESEWRLNLRMNREHFMELVEMVRPNLEIKCGNFRADALSVEKKVAMTLYYLKDQGLYRMTCNNFGVSLPCLSKTVKAVCSCINEVVGPQYLKLPKSLDEMKELISKFESRFGFPQAFGCLDGTHIPIRQPTENSQDYFCYKMKRSLNVQALCDYRGIFLDVEINWPGSVHDARVYANSNLNRMFTEKQLPMVYRAILPGTDRIPPLVLVDPAYPLLPNVMKEYVEDAYNEKAIFNQVLRSGRNQIECAFGRLKARWQILNRAINVKLEDVPTLVHACFVLHNFCELKACPIVGETIEHQMQLNIVDSCCAHHSRPDQSYSYNTATGTAFRKILTEYIKEYLN